MLRPSAARIAKGLYWDRAWSLVEGCTPVSPGCDNCWALRQTYLRSFNPNMKIRERYGGLISYDAFGRPLWHRVRPMEDDLVKITPKQKPRVIAIWNDLFHEAVPFDFIAKAFHRMAVCRQHLFLVLTKRPERALDIYHSFGGEAFGRQANIRIGFTAENQAWFDRRWEYARQIPTAGIFVSYEPALGPLILPGNFLARGSGAWVVAGGESGPKARPMHPEWPRRIRDDCQEFGVPFFFKQWGEWSPDEPGDLYDERTKYGYGSITDGQVWKQSWINKSLMWSPGKEQFVKVSDPLEKTVMFKVGKKAAGRLLDWREWNEGPMRSICPGGMAKGRGTKRET